MFSLLPEYIGQFWPTFMWSVIIVAAIGCIMGFHKFVWFMSVGYGFSVMVIGVYHIVYGLIAGTYLLADGTLRLVPMITSALLAVYGFRLGGFVLMRELKNAAYRKTLNASVGAKKMPFFVSLIMWIFSMFLYTAQTSAVSYRIINQSGDNVWAWIGVAIMALAIIGEATADRQKSNAKKVNPKRFCDTGLFKICRCPNYFSEILFWVGVTVSGIGSVVGTQWIVVLLALVTITYVMYNSAHRLELRHEKTYGLDPEYQKYSDTVPLLFPLTKQYHSIKVYRD